jgi:hypothetical protein
MNSEYSQGMRIFARWEARLALDYGMLTLQKFFLILLVAAHWLACVLMVGQSLWFRLKAHGLGFRAQGSGFRVRGFGFYGLGSGPLK